MAVWSVVEFLEVAKSWRFDAEYYRPQIIQYVQALRATGWKIKMLGDLVQDGYRVVYENTKILDEAFDPERHVKFLQAANIRNDFPIINEGGMGWVSRSDWERYPKGRIEVGEILVEVKGEAKKVVMVPAGLPAEVMVTGTLYKMQIDETQVDRRFILVYLLSELGRQFRDRAKTNTLISYVAKSELYSIPIPIPPDDIQKNIGNTYDQAFTKYQESQALYAQAEALLLHELGLDTLDLSHQTTFTATFAEVMEARRLDAEYFQPKYTHLIAAIQNTGQAVHLGDCVSEPIRRGILPDYVEDGDITVVNSQHVGKTHVELGDNRTTSRAFTQVSKNMRAVVKKYDVLLNSTGYITIGRAQTLLDDVEAVVDGHVSIIRPKQGLDPVYLGLYLNSLPGQLQTERGWTGSSGQIELRPEVVSEYVIWKAPEHIQQQVRQLVEASHQARKEASQLLEQAKQRVEELILGGET